MQDFNGIKIIGIDHGYGNIKTSNTVTPTAVLVTDSEPAFEGNVLFYNDKFYRFGEGHKPFIADKTEDEDFYAATLLAAAKELSREKITEANVHLAVGLPLKWVTEQRESFAEYLKKNPEVTFTYNRVTYHIKIVGVSVYPQGYSAVINYLKEMRDVNMVADIGNATVNLVSIHNCKPIQEKCHTEKMGVNQCIIAAKNAVLDKFHTPIDDTIIENIIRYKKANIGQKYLDCITSEIRVYAEQLLELFEKYEYNSELMRLYVTGGGGVIIRNYAEMDFSNVVIIGDICAGARGYETICLRSMKRSSK